MAISPWRVRLRPAKFKDAIFHVEAGARSGGRRLAPHEYPKRDDPYVEDMGRKMRGYSVAGYCIGPSYQDDRNALIRALEAEGSGTLVLPTLGEFLVKAGPYSVREVRERGGFCEFEMNFLEAGIEAAFSIEAATQDQVATAANAASAALIASGNYTMDQLESLRDPSFKSNTVRTPPGVKDF